MPRRWLVGLLASALACSAVVVVACGSFEAASTTAPDASADAIVEGGSSDAALDGSADAGARCGISEVSSVAPRKDCLGAGSSVDLTSSPLHCGRCGHSCLGGACAEGRCQAVILHDSKGATVLGGVTDTHVYYATGPDVQRVTMDASNVDVVARTDVAGDVMAAFVLAGDRIFVQTRNGAGIVVGKVASIASGDAGVEPLAQTSGSGFAADSQSLYIVSYADIRRLPIAGGAFSNVQNNLDQDDVVGPVSQDDTVYWIVRQGARDGGTPDQILYARSLDGTILERARNLGDAVALTVDATHLYWANRTTQSIMRVEREGAGLPTVVARWPGTDNAVKAVAVGGGRVYWTVSVDRQSGADVTIYEAPTCAVDGTVLVTTHPGGEYFQGLIIDSQYVYYGGLSALWRVPR